MTYAGVEASRTKGLPCNLFYMKYGPSAGSFIAYTDAEKPIVFDGVTYQPVSIQRGKIISTGTMDKSSMEIRLSRNSEVGSLFLNFPPSDEVNVTIRQGHLNDPDNQFLVGWVGRVISTKRTDSEVVLSCEPISTTMKRVGLRRHYQLTCMHVLFGSQCGASKSAATWNATVLSLTPSTVEVGFSGEDGPISEQHIGGTIEWINENGDPEIRAIARILGSNTFRIYGSFKNLEVGMSVDIVRGCARTMGACRSHDRIQNFGGCPWIPLNNPIGMSKNQFY